MDTRSKCLGGLDLENKRILEIGPLNRPLAEGENVTYADHCSTEELRKKYSGNPDVPPSDIRPIHIDLSRDSLAAHGPFDVVIASHVIEHIPDLIGWLEELAKILSDRGVLALVIPDKRYSFDVYRRETEFWMVQDARGNTRPSLRQVLDHFLNIVHVDTHILWTQSRMRSEFRPTTSIDAIEGLFELHRSGEYIDAHCWVFTPETFLTLFSEMERQGLPFSLQSALPTPENQLEFYVQLRRHQRSVD